MSCFGLFGWRSLLSRKVPCVCSVEKCHMPLHVLPCHTSSSKLYTEQNHLGEPVGWRHTDCKSITNMRPFLWCTMAACCLEQEPSSCKGNSSPQCSACVGGNQSESRRRLSIHTS